MKQEVFSRALINLIVANDFSEYQEGGCSFVIDELLKAGVDEEDALGVFERAIGAADAYLECFEAFGQAEAFEAFACRRENFEQAKAAVYRSLREHLDEDIEPADQED